MSSSGTVTRNGVLQGNNLLSFSRGELLCGCVSEVVDYAGVVLAPGNVLAVSFSGIHVPMEGANITG